MAIEACFPFKEFRPYQKEILSLIEANLDPYNYIFLEAPTGFGKSPVAYAIAKYVYQEYGNLTHFVVNDIYLQGQYLRDFPDIALIKGRGNYPCSLTAGDMEPEFWAERIGNTLYADRAPCTLINGYKCPHKANQVKRESALTDMEMGAEIDPENFEDDNASPRADRDKFGVKFDWSNCSYPLCAYWQAKDKAIHSPLTIHNYSYYLHEQNHAHSFNKRFLGIFDEAHTIENTLMTYIEVLISSRTFNGIWMYFKDMPFPIIPEYTKMEDWEKWLQNIQGELKGISEKYGTFASIQRDIGDSSNRVQELKSRKTVENITNRITELLDSLEDDIDNWVVLKDKTSATFKPVTINKYSDQLFKHTDKHILISATILDKEKLQKYLGIEEEVKFFRIGNSTFPVEHRPLYQKFAGRAIFKEMDQFLPNMLRIIDNDIIPTRLQHKGVIHTHNNEIARYIMANSKYKQYMMTNVSLRDERGNFIDTDERREDTFERFFQAKAPCIMTTPSMKMGIDLKDDLARWQVLVKVPYPSLGDPQIKKRVEKDQSWYNWTTAMLLIQTYGRVCRSVDDWGETFIIDGKFSDLFNQNIGFFPKWFKEAIR